MKNLAFLFLLILAGCKSVTHVASKSQTTSVKNEYQYYNSENRILYKVTNDDRNLHILLNTNDEGSIMKILRTGLTIYFDVSGKKKKDVFVHYPFKLNSEAEKQTHKNETYGNKSERTLNYFISQIPRKLIFSNHGKTENIDLNKVDSDIKDTITAVKDSEITYELTIPLSRISNNGILSLSNLSVGVVSGNFNITEGAVIKTNSDKPRDVAPGGVGSSPGGYEKPEVNLNAGGMDVSAMGEPIKFWFKLTLYK